MKFRQLLERQSEKAPGAFVVLEADKMRIRPFVQDY